MCFARLSLGALSLEETRAALVPALADDWQLSGGEEHVLKILQDPWIATQLAELSGAPRAVEHARHYLGRATTRRLIESQMTGWAKAIADGLRIDMIEKVPPELCCWISFISL